MHREQWVPAGRRPVISTDRPIRAGSDAARQRRSVVERSLRQHESTRDSPALPGHDESVG